MFTMPAEWAPHAKCWMAWPCRAEVWGGQLDETKRAYAGVAQAIARFEPVCMLVPPALEADARDRLGSDIELVPMEIDDSWARDSGPCFLSDGSALRALCFRFNAWGGKYWPYDKDAAMGRNIAAHESVEVVASELVAEGGGISVDGEGTLLTTASCFPHANRNPDRSREEIEAELKRSLGVEKVIWLPGNPYETETNGHVDGIAMFAAPGKVIVELPSGEPPEEAAFMRGNIAALEGATDAKGRPLELILLESASTCDSAGEPTYRGYINFYIANGAVIAPAHGVAADARAREVMEQAFPDREILQLPVAGIEIGGGGIHCITQQQPAV